MTGAGRLRQRSFFDVLWRRQKTRLISDRFPPAYFFDDSTLPPPAADEATHSVIMENWLIALAIGITAGVLGGIFGVGGGVLIVPALVLLLHTSQHTAVGTSLGALLPPVGLLGAWAFYRRGEINLTYSLWIG